MKPLNRSLKLIREYHRVKQGVLAKQLGISASYISEIEHGVKTPSIELLEKYSERFVIPLSSIMLFSEMQDQQANKIEAKITDKALKMLEWLSDTDLYAKQR